MPNKYKRIAIVTGTTSGIGEATMRRKRLSMLSLTLYNTSLTS